MNLIEFSVGQIVVKTQPRLHQHIIITDFLTQRVIDNFEDSSYIGDIYKIVGFGNSFAYVEQLSKYDWKKDEPNELKKIDCNKYGEGWEELIIPEGLTFEQICIK